MRLVNFPAGTKKFPSEEVMKILEGFWVSGLDDMSC